MAIEDGGSGLLCGGLSKTTASDGTAGLLGSVRERE
jgi:hypothetical protein